MTSNHSSYSVKQKRRIGFNVGISILAVLALVMMVNYLAARHYTRLPLSTEAKQPFSALTRTVLGSVTNEVKVTVFFDKTEPVYDSVWSLLKEYNFSNPYIIVELVDYHSDPVRALAIKNKYNLDLLNEKNLIVFDSGERFKIVHEGQLSELDVKSFTSGKTKDIRRTHFRGELEFTSAILTVTSETQLQAYFLYGHGEHQFDSEDKLMGYARFADVLIENNIRPNRLSLAGTNDVPVDCHLLIVAGPQKALLPEELEKLDRYLSQGGRMLVLFNVANLFNPTGLERLLADWGVRVAPGVVLDEARFSQRGQDMIIETFGDHPSVKPLYENYLYTLVARPVAPMRSSPSSSDGLEVEPLLLTTDQGRIITDVRPVRDGFAPYARPNDFIGQASIAVAVEKGGIQGVSAARGATRIVVVGESIFLGNETLPKMANRDFASHAVNWLLARHELLVGLAPQPITQYRINLTAGQMVALQWVYLLILPGLVLLVGLVVHLRRKS